VNSRTSSAWLARLALGFALGVTLAEAVWYINVYVTAQAKCDRGDLAACQVVALKRVQAEATAQAQYQAGREAAGHCLMGLPDHNVTIEAIGSLADSFCAGLDLDAADDFATWVAAQQTVGSVVCKKDYGSDLTVEVRDTGFQEIGSAICSDYLNADFSPAYGARPAPEIPGQPAPGSSGYLEWCDANGYDGSHTGGCPGS
jgi:hypothetical protein